MAELCRTTLGLSYPQALAVACATILACGLWLHTTGRRAPTGGAARLAAVAPVLLINAALPKLFCRWDDSTTIVMFAFNTMWLSSFKAISWAFGRGALCCQRFTPAQFTAVYAAPITPVVGGAAPAVAGQQAPSEPGAAAAGSGGPLGSAGRLAEDAGGVVGMLRNWAGKGLLISAVVQLLQHQLPAFLESFVMALYALLSLIMDGPAALLIGLTGLRVSPHFDRPWLATSVAAFWNKHWDLAAGNTLRQLVYDSVLEGSLRPPRAAPKEQQQEPRARPPVVRQLLGALASFAASGLVHEGIFWYLTGRTTGGVWLSFFLVQAPAVALERLALGALKRRGVLLPDWLRVLYTVSFEVFAAQHLFWAPCKRAGVTSSIVSNVNSALVAGVREARAAGGPLWAALGSPR